MLKNITLFKSKYKHINHKINEETTFKSVIKATLGALLFSLILIAIPGLLVYNLFVFHKIAFILKVVIIILIWGFSFLYNYFYDQILKNYHHRLKVLNTKTLVIADSIGAAIILTIFAIVFMQFF